MRSGPPHRRAFIHRLPFLILMGGSAKLLVDTSVQFFNPFLVVIAGGVGIGTVAMGRIIAMRSLTGLIAPVLGNLADRIGHRTVMRASLFTLGIAMIVAPLRGGIAVFAIAVVLTGVGQSGYTPNLHAYLSERLPYEKRAMGLGIIEYSWALAGIVGLFASGYLIETFSWKAPFYLLGALLVFMSVVFSALPDAEGAPAPKPCGRVGLRVSISERFAGFFHLGPHARSAWAAIAVTGLNMFAMMHVMIIHGGWLQSEYGLTPSRLGMVALILGLCDLGASVSVSLFVDRIGKLRSVTLGLVGMVIGFALMPVLNLSLTLAIASIAIPRLSFEFAVVSSFPLLSEQTPRARGKVMSLGMTAGLIGASLAALTGPDAYLRFGVWGLGPVSLALSAVSLALIVLFVRERPHYTEPAES